MYLPIGNDMSVRNSSIIGIFDLDNTSYSKHTRAFLRQAEENGMDRIYLTQFSAATLEKRLKEAKF